MKESSIEEVKDQLVTYFLPKYGFYIKKIYY